MSEESRRRIRYYRHADQSFWVVRPDDAHTEIAEADLPIVRAALDRGAHPEPQPGGTWTIREPDDPPPDVAARQLRAERDHRLLLTDWTQLPDSPLSEPEKRLWRAHRQQLRDLPDAYPDGKAVVWPSEPRAHGGEDE